MTDFLQHMVALAAREPCLVRQLGMLRLVTLADFERTHLAHHQVEAAGDPVVALRDGVPELVAMARR